MYYFQLEKKFINKQEYAEETDGSSIDDTDCEKSSEEEEECFSNKRKIKHNTKSINGINTKRQRILISESENEEPPQKNTSNKRKIQHNTKSINVINIKRKRILTSESENEEPPQKNKKTVYMETFNLAPHSSDTPNKSIKKKDKEINVDEEKIIEKIIGTENTNDDMTKKTSSDTEEVTEKILHVENIDDNNSINNLKFNEIENKCNSDSSIGDDNLVIDEDSNVGIHFDKTIPLDLNEEENDQQNGLNSSAITIDDNSNEPIITEPEEQLHEDEQFKKMVIETDENNSSEPIITEPEVQIHEGDKNIIEIDENDSDVEITGDPMSSKAPVHENSLETIIKSCMLNHKYFLTT